jgi:hypothetical protein
MKKVLSLIKYVLLLVCVLTLVGVLTLGAGSGYEGVDLMLYWAYALLAAAVLITVVLSAVNITKNPKGAKGSLLGVGLVIVVLVVTYFMSSTEPMIIGGGEVYDDAFGLRITDMQLYTTYIALAVAFLAAIFGEIRNSFK